MRFDFSPPARNLVAVLGARGRAISAIAIAAVACARGVARADGQPDSAVAARARELSTVGSLAASSGEYAFAIEAFEKAHALTAQPELLFSLGEAHRQRYALAHALGDLTAAVSAYRRYVAAGGPHTAAAARTLEKLEAELANEPAPAPPSEASASEGAPPRVAVISPIARASVRVDGGAPHGLPAFLDVTPGRHVLTVSAKDHQDGLAVIDLAPADLTALALDLEPAPARLDVTKPSEGEVFVDGVAVGTAPLPRPVDLDPGGHIVTVSLSGHGAHTEALTLERGKTRTLAPVLHDTGQRTAAWALLGAGGASLATGIALGVVAVVKDRAASSLAPRTGETLRPADQAHYDALTSSRDDFRLGSGIGGGVGLGLLVVGGVLYAFDVPPPPPHPKARRVALTRVAPLVGPGFGGAWIGLGFE